MSGSFTPDDIRILEKTLSVRERMLDHLLKDELPNKARDLDAYVNLMESMDRSVLGKAKVKVEEASNRVNEESKALLTNLLLDLHKGNTSNDFNLGDNQVPEFESTGLEVTDGELIRKTDEVDMSILETD